VDVRVIAATNRDLLKAVETGAFREDLFFRLNVVTITLPPLRERKEEIPQLVEFFLKKYCREAKKRVMQISPQAMKMLTAYSWQGNVRELQNAIERAVVLKTGGTLSPEDFSLQPLDLSSSRAEQKKRQFHKAIDYHKREIIRRALISASGNQTKAAEWLGLQRTYLARLIKQLDIKET
jgi:DNA-binding NtrC family response regulator